MTELAISEPTDDGSGSPSVLVQWAIDAAQAYQVAQSLAKTSFVPDSMQNNPHQITAAILTGQELGLQPMSALRSMDIINGTPALRAIALRALVQSHGHDIWVDEQTETRAIVKGVRKGSTKEQSSTWTIDRAKRLGVAGKANYQKQPGAMLVARATAECCRLVAADVLLGLPYAIEELDDEAAVQSEPTAGTKRRTARRQPLQAVHDEPQLPEAETQDQPEHKIVEADAPGEPEFSEDDA